MMFDLFREELDGSVYSSVEEYNADVLRVSCSLEEELGRTERVLLKKTPEVLEELGVEIKELKN